MLTCWVDKLGCIYSKDDPRYPPIDGLAEFRFDLEVRQTVFVAGSSIFDNFQFYRRIVDQHFESLVGTPEKLMEFAKEKKLPKRILAKLLEFNARRFYSQACGALEKSLTEACKKNNDPCLEGGCAMSEGESCLNACLAADQFYHETCVDIWIEMFKNPDNRIDVWKK